MALLNVSLSSKLPTKLPLSHHTNQSQSQSPHQHFSLPCYPAPHLGTLRTPPPSPTTVSSLVESISNASFLALLSASLLLVDPALAFKVNFFSFFPFGCLETEGKKKERTKIRNFNVFIQ